MTTADYIAVTKTFIQEFAVEQVSAETIEINYIVIEIE